MVKYKRNYKVILEFTSYKTNTDKYNVGDILTLEEIKNINFSEIIKDLNKRLINMDFLGTNIFLSLDEIDVKTILNSYLSENLVDKIELPGTLTIEINPAKVTDYEVEGFLEGIIDIVHSSNSKVMAIGYTINKNGDFKLVNEDEQKENTIIIDFIVKKMKEI